MAEKGDESEVGATTAGVALRMNPKRQRITCDDQESGKQKMTPGAGGEFGGSAGGRAGGVGGVNLRSQIRSTTAHSNCR